MQTRRLCSFDTGTRARDWQKQAALTLPQPTVRRGKERKRKHKEMLMQAFDTARRDLFSWSVSADRTPTSCVLRLWIITVQKAPTNALFNTPRGLWCVCACINVPQNHLRVCCLVLCFHVFMTRRTGFAFACDQVEVWGHTSLCEHLEHESIWVCKRGQPLSVSAAGEAWLGNPSVTMTILCFLFVLLKLQSRFVENNSGWEMFKAMPYLWRHLLAETFHYRFQGFKMN